MLNQKTMRKTIQATTVTSKLSDSRETSSMSRGAPCMNPLLLPVHGGDSDYRNDIDYDYNCGYGWAYSYARYKDTDCKYCLKGPRTQVIGL